MKTTNTDARIYCGTYAKYNSGSLKGAWFTLADYRNREEFLEACRELHADERDPELMFQDFEGFPRSFYCESSAPPEMLWEFLELDEDEAEAFEAYAENTGSGATVQGFRDAYIGKWDSGAEYAQESTEGYSCQPGSYLHLPELPAWLVIDWEETWEKLSPGYFTADAPGGGVFIFANS